MSDLFDSSPSVFSFEYVRKKFWTEIQRGTTCPCCERFAKVYERKLNRGMALALITFYKEERRSPGWFHAIQTLDRWNRSMSACGEYGHLEHFGLIESKVGEREDGNPSNGFYRLTETGRQFVERKIRVNRCVYIYDDKPAASSNPDLTLIDIDAALGEKFSYDELMRGE